MHLDPLELVDSFHTDMTYGQYWGWCKYRYREVDKKIFKDTKDAAQWYLDTCPTEII